MNALYRIAGDYLVRELEFMRTSYEDGANDASPYVVIAHEWAHAIADRLDPSNSEDAPALQADCLADLALYGVVSDGRLVLEEGWRQ